MTNDHPTLKLTMAGLVLAILVLASIRLIQLSDAAKPAKELIPGAPDAKLVDCDECHGHGQMDGIKCSFCDGSGEMQWTETKRIKCPVCAGVGTRSGECPMCGGSGKLVLERVLPDGTKILRNVPRHLDRK